MSALYSKTSTLLTVLFDFAAAGGPIKSFEQTLQEHHIELTKESLIAALQNPDPEVLSEAVVRLRGSQCQGLSATLSSGDGR